MTPLVALAAATAPLAIGFAPPLGQALRYETVERRPAADGERRFVMVHEVRFAQAGDGYRMDARLVSAAAEAPPDVTKHYDAAMRPFIGVSIGIALGPDGASRGPIDPETSWVQVSASLRGLIERLAADPTYPAARLAAARAYVERFAGMPAADRNAALTGWLLDLLAPPLLPRAAGQTAPFRPNDDGADGGTIRLEAEDAETARFSIHAIEPPIPLEEATDRAAHDLGSDPPAAAEARAAAATGLVEDGTLTISRHTGLVLSSSLAKRLGPDPGTTLLAERTVRRLP